MTAPKTIATLDCETDPFRKGRVPLPFLWDIFDGRQHHTFQHVEDVLAFLEDKPWIVYAHNGGKFDYHMPGFLAGLEPFAKIHIINGRLAKFKIGECEFRDSWNIFPMPLRAYKKDDINYEKLEKRNRKRFHAEIVDYLHGDTRYLHEMVSHFRADFDNALTLAGAAMASWQGRSGITAPRSTVGFYNRLQPYYYGGRVECFRSGVIADPFRMVDINSAYPYAMLHPHPMSTDFCVEKPGIRAAIIPQSLYTVDAISRGALPMRGKSLRFPDSDSVQRFTATGWEIQAGLDTETLKLRSIVERVDFTETVDFTKYINYWYDRKKAAEKDSADYLLAKLMMNSLYGKFGSNPMEYANFTVCQPKYVEAAANDGYEFAGELGQWCVLQAPLEEKQMRFYNVATAASVTGFVRAYLWRQICEIRANKGRVLYCDTDSVVFQGDIPAGMRMDKELGGWSADGEFIRGGIAGKKMYAFERTPETSKPGKEWKVSCKGVRLAARDIMRVCQGEVVKYERDAPSYGIGREPQFITRNVRMTAD